MPLISVCICVWAILGAVTPLSDDQRERLAHAVDGGDHHDEAFLALVENVRTWEIRGGLGNVTVRIEPDLAHMIDNPDIYRGEVCRISGELRQQTRLALPFDSIIECFVGSQNAPSALVYIVESPDDLPLADRQMIEVYARFYKRVEFIARDGKRHSYPAFVGTAAKPLMVQAKNQGASPLSFNVIGTTVLVLTSVFAGVWLWARSRRPGTMQVQRLRARSQRHQSTSAVDEIDALPDDPAQALEQLKRRAE
jgi:hypothetical protein